MKNAVFGVLMAVAGALAAAPPAKAQGYGYGYAYGPAPAPSWEQDAWREREARRAYRHEYWRQRREMAERRAYEAGRRDAYQQPYWAYR